MASSSPPPSPVSLARRAIGLSVHLLTASGVVWGFLALLAISDNDAQATFGWLAFALFVDGIDGPIARRVGVERTAPRYAGAVLDLIVDFLTYVIVPAYALMKGGFLPPGWDIAAGVIIVLSSAMYFADNEMKTKDSWFKGFPAVWNLVLFYFFLLRPEPLTVGAVVAGLAILTFVPVVFVHPFRVVALRPLTVTFLVAWSALAIYSIWRAMAPPEWVVWAVSIVGLYFVVLGIFRPKLFSGKAHD